jgi:hypothetical protein
MTAQSSGTVANGPGAGAPGSGKDPFCETFVTTLHQWCKEKPKRPNFDNMYFKNLKKDFPDIFNNMTRETPVVAFMKDGALKLTASTLAQLAHPLAALGAALLGAYNPSNGPAWFMTRNEMHGAFTAAKDAMNPPPQAWDCYPDGLSRDGKTWLEIKRPNDSVSKYQRDQHKAFEAGGGKVELAGCNCPGANCGEGGNGCPDGMGYAPADPI